jgi:C4-dicarboxylate transporter DctQ subunit
LSGLLGPPAEALHAASTRLERYLRVLLGLVLAALTGILFLQVVMRFVFTSPITWAEEFPRIILIWLVFLGLVPTMKGQHLVIDVLKDRPWLRFLSTAVKWAVLVFFLLEGIDLVQRVAGQRMPVTQISRAWQYAAAPVGAGLAAVVGIDEIVGLIRSRGREVTAMESVLSSAGLASEEDPGDAPVNT